MYTQVQATAPNASAPGIVPPTGFLWVDTSTTVTSPPAAAYFPPQAPPASGLNTFTDTSGEVWVSYNGSAWKKMRDACHVRVGRTALYTTSTAPVPFAYDTIDYDPLARYNLAANTFTCPVAGIYQVNAVMYVAPTAANQGMYLYLWRNAAEIGLGGLGISVTIYNVATVMSQPTKCAAGDTLSVYHSTTVAMSTTYASELNNWATFDYLGTG
jgi:hypothetical protein